MFERFTDRSRRVVVQSQEEARALNHNYIGSEHLLLGLLKEEGDVASQVFDQLGVTYEAALAKVEETVGKGQIAPPGHHIPFSPRAKLILEMALREALQLGDNFIGTEHLLLGLLRRGDGTGYEVLQDIGRDVSLQTVRLRILTIRNNLSLPDTTNMIPLIGGEAEALSDDAEEASGYYSWDKPPDQLRLELIGRILRATPGQLDLVDAVLGDVQLEEEDAPGL